ncbi:MAG TPA: phosphotransferase [Solirubrobacteraceae bacterium]|jgi:Ser/Thr protein kinase RdoA (MazF antagonist)|nr:phosphotransferase [Solirubrobacteraceae bacterium]
MTTENEQIKELARAATARFGLGAGATVTLCNVSENHTYHVEDPSLGARYALRVHRPGYRSRDEIESELMWIDALHADGVVDTPRVIVAGDGERVVEVAAPGVGPRQVVMFEWVAGVAPDLDGGDAAARQFETLGAISARMHEHARRWVTPEHFRRPRWDYASTIGPQGHWGRWQDGLGMGAEERRQLACLDARIAERVEAFGAGPSRFGLVHADIRLANLLIDGDAVRVIDFDDCGFSWNMYDFATAVSFMEDHPRVPELREAWIHGYRSVGELEPAAQAELQTFVMLRRLLLVAWIGSHHTFAPEAAQLGAGFTAGTCALAEDYLSTH